MATRKNTLPPSCLDCQHLLAELAKVQRQQRKQAADLRRLQAAVDSQAADLAEERERSRRLDRAISQYRFLNPYFLQAFSARLPQQNVLTDGLFHLN